MNVNDAGLDSYEILEERKRWRARLVSFVSGRWVALSRLVPHFTIGEFKVGEKLPANPHMDVVVRQPLTAAEQPVPVGVVSKSYSLVQHAALVENCLSGLKRRGLKTEDLKCELGLTALGEWMNFRVLLPLEQHGFTPRDNHKLGLKLECFNSVDGSSRLMLLLSWIRFVCGNGMIIQDSLAEVRDVHNQSLDLSAIPDIVYNSLGKVEGSLRLLRDWDSNPIDGLRLKWWADNVLSDQWGKKAACRVYHICQEGVDVDFADAFAKGAATDKPVKVVRPVPGACIPARSLYDVSQALSWVATERTDAEERVNWQTDIPKLIERLAASL